MHNRFETPIAQATTSRGNNELDTFLVAACYLPLLINELFYTLNLPMDRQRPLPLPSLYSCAQPRLSSHAHHLLRRPLDRRRNLALEVHAASRLEYATPRHARGAIRVLAVLPAAAGLGAALPSASSSMARTVKSLLAASRLWRPDPLISSLAHVGLRVSLLFPAWKG